MSKITAKDLYGGGQEIQDAINELNALKNTYVGVTQEMATKASALQASLSKTSAALGDQKEEFVSLVTKVAELTKQYELMQSKVKGIDKSIASYVKAQKAAAAATAKAAKKAKAAATANQAHQSSIKGLKAALKTATDQFDKLKRAKNATGDSGKKLIQTMARLKAEIDETNKEKKKAVDIAKLEIRKANEQVGSYNRLAAQYDLLKIRLNAMSAAKRSSTKEGRDMENQSKAIYEEMKRLQAATGKTALNVGNYKGSLVGAVSKQQGLVNQLKKTKEEFSRLPSSVQKSAAAQAYHTKVTDKLGNEIRELENITGRQLTANENSTKSHRRVGASLRNLVAVYFSVTQAAELFRKVFTDTKKLDSLNLAFEKTIPNMKENAQVQKFIADTAESYGQNVLVLSKAYLRFNAASKSSTLSMKEQQQIFDSVAKSASVLGLEAAKTDRVFNALEQIMSKGTVSAEELRQQLGDSLPGSVEIMARALKVSTKQLADMIKQGKVLASDALPKFAKELEKTYGIENVDRVDNLAAAQGRFETSIINLVKELDAADVFKDFFETLTAGAKTIGNNIELIFLLAKAVGYLTLTYGAWIVSTRLAALSTGGLTLAFNKLTASLARNPFGVLATAIAVLLPSMISVVSEINKIKDANNTLSDASKSATEQITKEKSEVDSLFRVIKDGENTLSVRQAAYDRLVRLYPTLVEYIDLEKSSTEELKIAQDKLNGSISASIKLRKKKEAQDALYEQKAEAELGLKELELNRGKDKGISERLSAAYNNAARLSSTPTAAIETLLTTFFGSAKDVESAVATNYRLGLEAAERQLKGIDSIFGTDEELIAAGALLGTAGAGTGGTPTTPPGDTDDERKAAAAAEDKRIRDDFARRKLKASILKEGLDKELVLQEISNDELEYAFKKAGLETNDLQGFFLAQRFALIKKFFLEEQKAQAEADDDKKKKQEKADKEELDRIKKAEEDRKKLYESNLKEFDKRQETEKLKRFSEEDTTPFQDALFDVDKKKERVEFDLFQRTFVTKDLTKTDADLFEQQLAALDKERENIVEEGDAEGKEKDLYDLLGINIDDKSKKAVGDAFSFAKKQLTDFANFRKQIADQNVASANKEVDSAEQALNREIAARNAGFASSVTTAEAELAAKKKIQADALKEQRAAQKEQQVIQSIEQAANLVTAATQIFTDAPIWLAIPLVATMFGAFASAKIRANNLTKQYADGAYEEFDYGGSHKSGNDMSLGMTKDGRQRKVERGESMMILPKAATKKYRGIMPDLFKSLRAGTYDPSAMDMSRESDVNYWTNTTEVNNDDLLSYFRSRDRRGKKGKNVIYSNGVEIVTNGNTKTYIHG